MSRSIGANVYFVNIWTFSTKYLLIGITFNAEFRISYISRWDTRYRIQTKNTAIGISSASPWYRHRRTMRKGTKSKDRSDVYRTRWSTGSGLEYSRPGCGNLWLALGLDTRSLDPPWLWFGTLAKAIRQRHNGGHKSGSHAPKPCIRRPHADHGRNRP